MKQVVIKERDPDPYGFRPKSGLTFFRSGCALLDCVLGGGYALGRFSNIIGDHSSGKSLLLNEACANFRIKFTDGPIRVIDRENTNDRPYAEHMGFPKDAELVTDIETVEGVKRDLFKFLRELPNNQPALYAVDSWDALTDEAELERNENETEKGTYGMNKAKFCSELFRVLHGKLKKKKVCVIIVSQVRDNVNALWGEKHRRSGGKALDFYASHCLWLAQLNKIKAVRKGVTRKIGVNIRAMCKKNKIGVPYRECDFPILFYYGVDDITALATWLADIKRGDMIDIKNTKGAANEYARGIFKSNDPEFIHQTRRKLAKIVRKLWDEIEESFLVPVRKYDGRS